MTQIKIFKCGRCKPHQRVGMTRRNLRKHLREKHNVKKNITNTSGEKKTKQKWWIEDE